MVDYDFYVDGYRGSSIPQEEWPACEQRAAAQLERYERIYQVTALGADSEPKAVCAIAEALYTFDLLASGEAGPVQSASVGSVSVSYGGTGAQTLDLSPRGREKELYRCASLYLDIYRGVG
ncbi:MAG: hypothetical protein HFF59_08490 [Lawsonibacter sp.]|nr:hypothetical protein [Lawsonibacter sp.]MCI9567583.1 hypothetical protein [Lawsonibacter sp.]